MAGVSTVCAKVCSAAGKGFSRLRLDGVLLLFALTWRGVMEDGMTFAGSLYLGDCARASTAGLSLPHHSFDAFTL
jgi:hypothetical protein